MKRKNVYYLGSQPPPYGGVTVKNQLLSEVLCKHCKVYRSKNNNSIAQATHIIKGILFGKYFLIGSGTNQKLINLAILLKLVCRKKMNKSIVFVMGGTLSECLHKNTGVLKFFNNFRWIYVETDGMMEKLKKIGLLNVSVLPNCRKKPELKLVPENSTGILRCVFFSLISKSKGADNVLAAAKILSDIQFDFYGHIDDIYCKEFLSNIGNLKNVEYKGVFMAHSNQAVFEKLHEYDLLLLPTRWVNEGVPGVLVEAKIAALPAVVSNICYNAEIVEDGVSGVVLEANSVRELSKAIKRLDSDRNLLLKLKNGAKESAKKYYIENYLPDILMKMEL